MSSPKEIPTGAEKLLVPREEFRAALRILRKNPLAGVRAAVVTSREGMLRIDVDSNVCEIEVEGGWLGRAEVPVRPFLGLASRLPKEDPLEIWIHEGILHIGPLWMKIHPKASPPPLSAAERAGLHVETIRQFQMLSDKAAAALTCFQRRIPVKRDAELRVMKDCAKAAVLLQGYGIREEEIWKLVTRRIALLAPRLR